MKSRFVALLTLSVAIAGTSARAGDGPPKRQWPEPDHLVPVDPYPGGWHTRYTDRCFKKLQVPRRFAAMMIVMPAFEPEECLVLEVVEGTGSRHRRLLGLDASIPALQQGKGVVPQFRLVHTSADQNIWYAMPANNDDKIGKVVKVARQEAPFPPELAKRVSDIWEKMLRKTHYPRPEDVGGITDATRFEFRRGRMCGEVRSPFRGSPLLLVELGTALADYCSTDELKRPAQLKVIEERCRALEEYLGDHP